MDCVDFIQWNCRGIKNKQDEIKLLIQHHDPIACCFQETFLKEEDNFTLRGYTFYNIFSSIDAERACGGVSVVIRNDIPQAEVTIVSPLQAKAVQISTPRKLTICTLYLSPSLRVDARHLDDLIDQLPSPFLILGDFNAHNLLWGCTTNNTRGNLIEKIIEKHDLCLFNDSSYTHINPATLSTSAIDLSLCHPSIYLNYAWKVADDLYESDHFPIFLTSTDRESDIGTKRWQFHRADWTHFQLLCEAEINNNILLSLTPTQLFTDTLLNIAEKTMTKSSGKRKRPHYPWFNDKCKEAISQRRKALAHFRRNITNENLNVFKRKYALARRTVKEAKKDCWRTYVSKLNSRTPIKKTWEMIRRISGKNNRSKISFLKTANSTASTPLEISNTLADTISKNSSSSHYSKKFQIYKKHQERSALNFSSDNSEYYNSPFTLIELRDALANSKDTAVGPDDIHYQILKHLPGSTLNILLQIFNNIWQSGNFPASWREAIIIPVSKPNKDPTNPNNYRPIALTSCLCKTLERIINNRLVHYLEINNLLTPYQSGFRKHRSTNDQLVRLETFIREAFINNEHMAAIFFDLEKAYDTTWKYGIMKDLHRCGLKGNLPIFIENFLNDRYFRVRINTTLSKHYFQENGVPQGAILSVTLFILKINSIVDCLKEDIDGSLYVDDFLISCRSKNMFSIERKLQLCLNRLQRWCDENGFKFSKSKTVCVHFCQKRGLHPDPDLLLDGSPIPVVPETKFLGVIFDKKLNFVPHLKHLKVKCTKALNIIKVVAKTDWGADRKVLLRLYRALIRSKLDYGCIVYGSARKSYLQMLEPVANQGLRLCLGAFRTSNANSLHVEANELPLSLRRQKLSLQYAIQLAANSSNPTHPQVFNPNFEEKFQRKEKAIPTFGLRIRPIFNEIGIDLDNIRDISIPIDPPWEIIIPKVNLSLTNKKKSETNPSVFVSDFCQLREAEFSGFEEIFTDGSKDGDRVAAAAITPEAIYTSRLHGKASIFTAELRAIDLALTYINLSTRDKFVIFSDSKSCIESFSNFKPINQYVKQILSRINYLMKKGKSVALCWIPSHIGIKGNELADRAAKTALEKAPDFFLLPHSDFKCYTTKYIYEKWQVHWSSLYNNKLLEIKPILGEDSRAYFNSRKEEVIMARLRIGHTYFTHSFLLKAEDPPECIPCQEPLTVKHILLDCVDFNHIRENYYTVGNIKQLFETVKPNVIISYLKEIGLYNKF